MKRRDFISYTIKISGGLLLGGSLPSILLERLYPEKNIAKAAENELFSSNLDIKRNAFSFAELEPRKKTDRIIIHHSGILSSNNVTARDIDAAHKANGWAGIGYHMFIHRNGLIETGRPLADIGAHTYHYNADSIGICLHGSFNEEIPSNAQLVSLQRLTALLCQMYSISPGEETIKGHRDFNATICPGDNLYSQLPQLRRTARRIMGLHVV